MNALETHRADFLEALRVRRYARSTLKHYGGSLEVFFRFLIERGVDDPREVSRELVRDYRQGLLARHRSIWTVHVRLIALRRFFEHLEKTDAILLNPCAGLVLPKLPDRLPRNVLTPGEAVRILNMPDTQRPIGIRDRAILELFYSTGIRLEEMTRLSIHDVDTRNGFLRVNRGKFAKDRVVPMGRQACDYVREYLAKVRAAWSRERREERALWLSSYQPHLPLKKQLIATMVKAYGRQAGLEKRAHPHAWRHACATHLVAAGSNVAYVQRLLGHRSLATTQVYTRVSVPDLRRAVGRAHPRARSHPLPPQSPTPDHDETPRFFSRGL